MTQAYTLSVLDQSPIADGQSARDALANSIDLARACDAAGYARYWVAEHHASPGLAGAAPEVLIGPIALATRRIRVGSGGIMLPHYSPFKVAETFAMLDALAPGRIDLGLGRAPGSDQRTAYALQRDRSKRIPPNDFPQMLAELLAYLDGTIPADHAFAALARTLPGSGTGVGAAARVEPWLLGSSMDSAIWAAEAGLPYCFADFINPAGAEMAEQYHRRFRPSARLAQPHVMAALWTIAAPTREEAERLSLPSQMLFWHLLRGELIPVPSVETAFKWRAADPSTAIDANRRRRIVGTPADVRAGLDAAAKEYGADELMLVNILPDHATRRRSYELVAAEYKLAPFALAA